MASNARAFSSSAGAAGGVDMVRSGPVRTALPPALLSYDDLLKYAEPRRGLPKEVNDWRESNIESFKRKAWFLRHADELKRDMGVTIPHFYGRLSNLVVRCLCNDPRPHMALGLPCLKARYLDYGLASARVVTDVGVDFIVDAFQDSVELETMKFHGIGVGSNAEAAADTALDAELTTEYQTDNTRATGSTEEGASTNIYRTVGTNTVDSAVGIEEHGIFDQADVTGGVLLDRSNFAVINLGNGDSLQSTYDLTLTAGG